MAGMESAAPRVSTLDALKALEGRCREFDRLHCGGGACRGGNKEAAAFRNTMLSSFLRHAIDAAASIEELRLPDDPAVNPHAGSAPGRPPGCISGGRSE